MPDQVYHFIDTARLPWILEVDAGQLSCKTLNRLHAAGDGPERIRLTIRLVGYRLDVLRRWRDGRDKA